MITEKELEISNKSYTNKDFESIYTEVLDLATKLSSNWTPDRTNESDPGIVLLKLLAFVGDKMNYNIDKNTLETFLPSATQETSVRNLCETNGYFPRYYRSATCDVSVTYSGEMRGKSFTLKAFKTTFEDKDSQVAYVLIQDLPITQQNATVTRSCIQGKLSHLVVGNSTKITLECLDDNNRIYFPEVLVAENGVYINDVKDWHRVDNLNATIPGERVFKFGYDSVAKLPYIEFPNDISSLIGEGFEIDYVITNGASGNIKAKYLTQLADVGEILFDNSEEAVPLEDEESGDVYLYITNDASSINGEDPETIDEAYNSFKKTVGTFDTLVTCRDYANAIYNLFDEDDTPMVSNCQVADRRTDYNYSNNVVTFSKFGKRTISLTDDEVITPFELCLYPLQPIKNTYTLNTYNNSFKPLADTTLIKQTIEDSQTISHNYKNLKQTDVYAFKNYVNAKAIITTNYKVNAFEQFDIISNVYEALYKNFNARKMDYGQELNYDDLYNVIKNADRRIKNISLDEPNSTARTYALLKSETEVQLNSVEGKNYRIDLLAKNIVAGKLSLFNFDDSFVYDFGQSKLSGVPNIPIKNLNTITTTYSPTINSTTTKIGKNEVVQFIALNLVDGDIYPAYVNYSWDGGNNQVVVGRNEEHKIVGDEVLYIEYTDTNQNQILIQYRADRIINKNGQETILTSGKSNIFKPSFTLAPTASIVDPYHTPTKVIDGVNYFTIGTKDTISMRETVQVSLNGGFYCYWVTNKPDNLLNFNDSREYLLEDGEYFLYTNAEKKSLATLGSGTLLTLDSSWTIRENDWKIKDDEGPSLEEISESGINAFKDFNWKRINFTNKPLTLTQNQVLTLAEGDVVKSTEEFEPTNAFTSIPSDAIIKYQLSTEETESELPVLSFTTWKVRSRLDLDANQVNPQILKENESVTFYGGSAQSGTLVEGDSDNNTQIYFNAPIQISGGENIDVSTVDSRGTVTHDLCAYICKYNAPTYKEDDIETPIVRGVDKLAYIPLKNIAVSNLTNQPQQIYLPFINLMSGTDGVYFMLSLTSAPLNTTLCVDAGHLVIDETDYYSIINTIISEAESDEEETSEGGERPLPPVRPRLIHLTLEEEEEEEEEDGESLTFLESGASSDHLSLTTTEEDTMVIVKVLKQDVSEVTITVSYPLGASDGGQLVIGELKHGPYASFVTSDIEEDLMDAIKTKSHGKFYYTHNLDNTKVIDYDITSPLALYEYNNVANKYTITQIDFEHSSIEIASPSKLN